MTQGAPSFEQDIRPLFRDRDVNAMDFMFDLSSYDDVKENAEDIYAQVERGAMPCDGGWPTERVQLFRNWVDSGTAP